MARPPQLSDRDRASDMLAHEKQLAAAYVRAELESANKPLREALHRLHAETEDLHAELFHVMHQRGWYVTPTAGQQAIEQERIRWEQAQAKHPELRP